MVEETCPGCGLSGPAVVGSANQNAQASATCWAYFTEITAYTLTHGDPEFIHQHALDAYTAQHVAASSRPLVVAFALIGVYLACERGYTGRQVQQMHRRLANRSHLWPQFVPPLERSPITILDCLMAQPGAARDAMLRRWAHSVWAIWRGEHAHVQHLLAQALASE